MMMMMAPKPTPTGTVLPKPFCAACGHDLTGAVNSANCPECGRPLVEVLVRPMFGVNRSALARRYESKTRVFGMPLVAIASGVGEDGKPAHAKGFFALGDIATGVFAFGGLARGVVAFGGAAFGGGAVALLGSAVGGFAAGIVAAGGGAVGLVAQGGFAIGWLARGASAKGVHAWSGRGAAPDAATQAVFDQYAWLVGPSGAAPQIHYNLLWTVVIAITVAVVALLALALPLLVARSTRDPIAEELNR